MLKEDFAIQSIVRRILVRSNIDYTKIDFGTVKGVVYFRGLFRVTRVYTYGDDEVSRYLKSEDYVKKTLSSLEKKVRGVIGVKDVSFEFLNWRKERGVWVRVEERKKKGTDYGQPNESAP